MQQELTLTIDEEVYRGLPPVFPAGEEAVFFGLLTEPIIGKFRDSWKHSLAGNTLHYAPVLSSENH